MRVRGLILSTAALLLLLAPSVFAQVRLAFEATGSFNGQPVNVNIDNAVTNIFTDVVTNQGDSALPISLATAIRFGNNLGADVFRWDFELWAPENSELAATTYEAPVRTSGGRGAAAYMSLSGSGSRGTWNCNTLSESVAGRRVVINSLSISEAGVLESISLSFTDVCSTGNLTGTLRFSENGELPGGDGDPGDGGEEVPPREFNVRLPEDFDVEPLVLNNNSTKSIDAETTTSGTFDSDVHLSILSDALEHEDLRVSISPSVIPAPGAGDAVITIGTGPHTFPRIFQVTVLASANEQISSRSFLVQVLCDPPFILGTDQPKSITAANGSQVTLEVKPSGSGPFTYQWFRGVPGMTRDPVLAANESKLIFTTRETANFWVRVSNACGSANSNAVTVTTTGSLAGPAKRRGGRSN